MEAYFRWNAHFSSSSEPPDVSFTNSRRGTRSDEQLRTRLYLLQRSVIRLNSID